MDSQRTCSLPSAPRDHSWLLWIIGVIVIVGLITLGFLLYNLLFGVSRNYAAYMAYSSLFTAFTIGIGSLLAVSEFIRKRLGVEASINAAVFDQYKMFLSINYQREVRHPAWISLLKAKQDKDYCKKLLAGLAGELTGDEVLEYAESNRKGLELTQEDKMNKAIHDDYHRVQDILGFFSMLSFLSLNADRNVVDTCSFFYDLWRMPLHRIICDLKQYVPPNDSDKALEMMRKSRYDKYAETLDRLDFRFGYKPFTAAWL